MRSTARLWAAFVAGGTLLLVASCTSSTADGSTSTSVVSMTVSPSVVDPSTLNSASPVSTSTSSIEPSTPVSGPSDISPQEAADRAAVELAWSQFWSVSDDLWRLPEAERAAAASTVAVEPTLSQTLEQARDFTKRGVESYGSPVFHPYWQQPVAGNNQAVMGDCTDTSQTGSMVSATGEKKTVGVLDNNTRATFVRGDDGRWRVEKIFYLVDQPCP